MEITGNIKEMTQTIAITAIARRPLSTEEVEKRWIPAAISSVADRSDQTRLSASSTKLGLIEIYDFRVLSN